jgi:hypothetical protein
MSCNAQMFVYSAPGARCPAPCVRLPSFLQARHLTKVNSEEGSEDPLDARGRLAGDRRPAVAGLGALHGTQARFANTLFSNSLFHLMFHLKTTRHWFGRAQHDTMASAVSAPRVPSAVPSKALSTMVTLSFARPAASLAQMLVQLGCAATFQKFTRVLVTPITAVGSADSN